MCYDLSDSDLLGLICQATGAAAASSAAKMTSAAFRFLKTYADFNARPRQSAVEVIVKEELPRPPIMPPRDEGAVGLNLSYTINLNLPATTDQAVFNAIFKSLKEHLLNG